MQPSRRIARRRYLSAVAGLGVVSAGCSGLTGDTDERVDATPPGSSALDPGGSWPSYRFDAGNTGYNPDGTGLRDAEEYWRLDAGSSATVSDGALYNVHSRGRETRVLTVRSPRTAAVEAEIPLVEYGVSAPPVVADGQVFVATFIELFCFDAESGERRWAGPEMDGIQGPPSVDDGTAYVNSGGFESVEPHVRAFDATDGDERWRYDTGHESKGAPAVGDGRVFVTSEAGLHAIDAATGEETYALPVGGSRWGTPVVHDGTVYAVESSHETDELVAIEAAAGDERWRTESGGAEPVVTDDLVYAATDDGLVGLDVEDGSVATRFERRAEPLALVGDVLYGKEAGTAMAFDVTTGDRLWTLRTEEVQIADTTGRSVYGITPVDGAVYVSARDAFYGLGPSRD